MKSLIITLVGILLGLVASLINLSWLAVFSTFIAVAGAIGQYRDSIPFELVFSQDSWQPNEQGFKLVIPRRVHKKKAPIATLFWGKAPFYEEVFASIAIDADDSIIISAHLAFNGKAIIR